MSIGVRISTDSRVYCLYYQPMNSYELSRSFFNFSFDNPDIIKPNHIALYFFIIEHCNRLGWKQKFGLPTTMTKEAIGIRSYNTYINTLNDLVDWGFITLVEKSKNQYSSNIVAISKNDKAQYKALDKALIKHSTKHVTKQSESTVQSIDSIDKQETKNKEQDKVKEFYTNQIELIENKNSKEKYSALVDFLYGQNSIERPLNVLLKYRDQLTFAQYETLKYECSEHNQKLFEVLLNMESVGNPKKRLTIHAHALNFIRPFKK